MSRPLPSFLTILNPTTQTHPDYDPSLTTPIAMALSTSLSATREISLVEKTQGVEFNPALSAQRQEWVLGVLREWEVESVLDVGCGEGTLLETLTSPPSTIPEPPILAHPASSYPSASPSPARNGRPTRNGREARERGRGWDAMDIDEEEDMGEVNGKEGGKVKQPMKELFLHRLAGLDVDPSTLPLAVQRTAPPSLPPLTPTSPSPSSLPPSAQPYNPTPTAPYIAPRWQRLQVEIWQGGLERHNERLEGFDAIVAMEVIEHLDAPSLAIFPQMVFGTLRPRIVLITTPNFEFNAKFPRAAEGEDGCGGAKKGWLDPSKRTDRVFRHSDHKFEWTEREFRDWCDGAEEWGYSYVASGVGISNQPSYHDDDPSRPLYATQTAVFKKESTPTRSPRSVRTASLPFMPGSSEKLHPHRLAAIHIHDARGIGAQSTSSVAQPIPVIRDFVRQQMDRWRIPVVSINELWGVESVASACGGSKRTLIGALGGWGDVEPASVEEGGKEFEVFWPESELGTLSVRWAGFKEAEVEEKEVWGQPMNGVEESTGPQTEW